MSLPIYCVLVFSPLASHCFSALNCDNFPALSAPLSHEKWQNTLDAGQLMGKDWNGLTCSFILQEGCRSSMKIAPVRFSPQMFYAFLCV